MSILTVGSYKVIDYWVRRLQKLLLIYQRSRLSKLIPTGNARKNIKIAFAKSKVTKDL